MPNHRKTDLALLVLLAAVLAASLVIGLSNPDFFSSSFAVEDGPVEYGTSVLLFIGAAAFAMRALRGQPIHGGLFAACSVLYALLFFFAAGEEISWGQRLLGLQSGEFFVEHNDQAEITLHNMVVFGVKLDEVVFGNLLSLVLLLYLLVLPLLWPRWGWVRRLCTRFAVPVPRPHHAVATLVATAVMLVLQAGHKWEVYEFAFAAIALGIALHPREADGLPGA